MKLALIVLLAVAGAGAGAYLYFVKAAPAQAKEAEPEPEPPPPTGIVPLEPFVVNLADTGVSRFLRVNLGLVVQDEEQAKEIEEHALEKARIRSAILELLAEQAAETLVTPEGKLELKKLIAERVRQAAHELEVVDVLFSEFVIQF
ncbi:MAG TPA: flagellar basal body-associated FliL family protein [Vicinamibacterales bacterium]